MKNLFIYLTTASGMKTVNNGNSISALENLDQNHPFCLINENHPTANNQIDASDSLNAILILESIDKKTFCCNIKKIVCNYDKIYVVHHSQGLQPSDINNTSDGIKEKILFKKGEHQKHNPLYSTALNFINGTEKAIEKALQAFEGDPVLESLINLRKSLCLLPLKIKNGILKNENFNKEIEKIKNREELKLAVEKFLSNGEPATPETLDAKITAIETEIINLSTTRQ